MATAFHLCCQVVWSGSRDLEMLEEKEKVIVGLQLGQAGGMALSHRITEW